MSLQTVSMVLSATSTTLHHNWAKAMSDALTALGVLKTSDTGQINLTGTTLAYPGGIVANQSAYSGYEIRKLSASGKPDIFLKIHYGIYANNGTSATYYYPSVRIEVGTGSDGAGNLTSPSGNHEASSSSNSSYGGYSAGNFKPSPTAQNCYFASDGQNYLTIVMGSNAPAPETSIVMGYALERTIEPSTGAYNSKGCWTRSSQSGNDTITGAYAWQHIVYDFNNLIVSGMSGQLLGYAQAPNYVARFQPGVNANLFPHTCVIPEPQGIPTVALGYYPADMVENTQFNATLYGVSHTYITLARTNALADAWSTTRDAIRID